MTTEPSNVVQLRPHSSSAREQRERRKQEKLNRLEQAIARLQQTRRVSEPDARRLATNLGSLASRLAADTAEKPKHLLRRAFEVWAMEDEGADEQDVDLGYRWSKRQRWVRLSHEQQSGGRFATNGADFVRLAEFLCGLSKTRESRSLALFALLSGTSFDPDPSGGAKAEAGLAALALQTMEHLRTTVLDAVGNELSWYFRVISDNRLRHTMLPQVDHGPEPHLRGWDYNQFEESDDWPLDVRVLHEGHSTTEEGLAIASLLPKVQIATVRLVYDDYAALVPDPLPEDWVDEAKWPSSSFERHIVSLAWDFPVYLCLLPIGDADRASIVCCLLTEAPDDWTLSYGSEVARAEGALAVNHGYRDNLVIRNIPRELPQFGKLYDLAVSFRTISSDAATWALTVLRSEPPEYEIVPVPAHIRNVSVFFKSTASAPPAPASDRLAPRSTLLGIIQRNLLFASAPERLDSLLVGSVEKKVQTLRAAIAAHAVSLPG